MEKTDRNSPYVVDVTAGKYAWCSCGYSQNRPYCDGAHKQAEGGHRPVVVEIEVDKKVAWCGCGKTGNQPYCDGSHSRG